MCKPGKPDPFRVSRFKYNDCILINLQFLLKVRVAADLLRKKETNTDSTQVSSS